MRFGKTTSYLPETALISSVLPLPASRTNSLSVRGRPCGRGYYAEPVVVKPCQSISIRSASLSRLAGGRFPLAVRDHWPPKVGCRGEGLRAGFSFALQADANRYVSGILPVSVTSTYSTVEQPAE
jgi:hypothetical protein